MVNNSIVLIGMEIGYLKKKDLYVGCLMTKSPGKFLIWGTQSNTEGKKCSNELFNFVM